MDLFPTCCALAHVPAPKADFDGEDVSAAFRGKPLVRRKDLLWDYGRLPDMQRPGLAEDQSPNLAIRSGGWKLLINDDGSQLELYDFHQSDRERNNVAKQHPAEAGRLSQKLLDWRRTLPVLQS